MVMVMLKQIRKKTRQDKIDKVECFFNRQVMTNYGLKPAKIPPDAIGTITLDVQEYARLKEIEHQWVNETQDLLLSDELMQHDLELMKEILNQGG